jgi:multicomponent Na+:H+ antiporter subunit A
MPLTISIAAYFVIAAAIFVLRGRAPRFVTLLATLPFVGQLALVLAQWGPSDPIDEVIEWIPSLGVVIGLRIDPLGLILTAVVAGIGLLIVIYSHGYFRSASTRARFLALMAVFTGGMAGIVTSDELLGLFIFWEITTIASYLLIGFDDEKASARSAALQAILVTTAGGLAMLAGFILLAMEAGTTTISEIVSAPPTGAMVTTALLLVFLGAFTKSAQFPFQFWLPGAMAAPTPASAFLHSATMVKAGIVLLLLLAPGFADETVWQTTVTAVGLTTMAVGAFAALRQRDLKLLLAHGTVSQLGFMVALVGLGHTGAALGVLVAHALFKATLFLVTGIVDKAAGTRDIGVLRGVGRALPVQALVGAIAALSMAGVPPMLGFVTKETAFDTLIEGGEWLALAVIALASALTAAYSAQWWYGAFASKGSESPATVAPTPRSMDLGPGVLSALTVVLGLVPAGLAVAVGDAVGESVKFVLWPGVKPALVLSGIVLAAGGILFSLIRGERAQDRIPSRSSLHLPASDAWYAASIRGLNTTADRVTGIVQNGSLPIYLAVILTAVLTVPLVVWVLTWDADPTVTWWYRPAEVALAGVAIVGAIAATRVQRRMAAALMLGVVGYAVAGIFVIYSAPDLALTQLLIETLTVALFALVLAKLPRRFGAGPASLSRTARIVVATFVGSFVTIAALITTTVTPGTTLTDDYVANAPDAGGSNVVNIILTNFRALDTLGEITVLAAAGIGISALVLTGRERRKERSS